MIRRMISRFMKENEGIKQDLKQHVSIGLNAVARGLERGSFSVIVCAKVRRGLLTRHLYVLAGIRKIPVCALSLNSTQLGNSLGVKSAIAVGFKAKEMNPFEGVANDLKKHSKYVRLESENDTCTTIENNTAAETDKEQKEG